MTQKASPDQLTHLGQLAAAKVQNNDHVGLGSGKAALAFVRALGDRIQKENLKITAVPTSLLTEKVARESAIPIKTLAEVTELDIAIDGADEVDPDLNLLKGGGGNLTREKIIASISKKLVIVVGEEKLVDRLGTTFPVFLEVLEFARPVLERKLAAMGARVEQRKNDDNSPFLTDNNNPYLHCHFKPELLKDPAALDRQFHAMPGIVETGLFICMANEVLIARADGTTESRQRPAG
jgi:ribose 5-phosphate isomerase A